MKAKINGFILNWRQSDHEGTHIHVYRDNRQAGVWDMTRQQAIRGLKLSKKLKEAIELEHEINQRLQQQQ
jgi:hypothetical protein